MRKKLTVGVILALLLAVASLTVAAASAKGDGDHEIHLIAKTVQFALNDLPPEGVSLGDRLAFADDLFQDGKQVGDLGAECTLVRLDPVTKLETYQCLTTLRLPKGQITVQGLVGDETTIVHAITGGTGAYSRAHGEIKTEIVGETEANLTLSIE